MTKLQFRVLYREFLFRMVDLEVLSAHALGDSNKLLGQFASLLISINLPLCLGAATFAFARLAPPARLGATLRMEHFLIATTMLVVGLFAVLSWDSTFPDRRDVLVLAPLPLRARTMFLAKVAAVATALCLTVALLHCGAGFLWPMAFAGTASPQTAPVYTFDPTPVPVSAAGLQSLLNRDLAQALASGGLKPGTGAGLAIGVSKHGEWRVFTYGTAKADSLFEIGSLTKTFTGLMLAQMIAQGKVARDEPIRRLLPPGLAVMPRGGEITLADLAAQHPVIPWIVRGDWQEYLASHGVGGAPRSLPYSDFSFGLLGYLLADRAGLTYSDLLKEQITGPLGLNDTVVSLSPEQQSRLIQGYDEEHQPVPWDAEGLTGSGAIRSTAGDMLKYLEAYLHPQKLGGTMPLGRPGTARAWYYDAANGAWSYGSAMPGFTGNAFFNPKGDYAAVVLLNNGPDPMGMADLLSEHIRQRLAGEPAISLDSVFVPAGGSVRWCGAYWFTMLSAGVFIYCCVLGAQGLAAQVLPRRWFLRASGWLQLAAFSLFVCVYFLQPGIAGLQTFRAPETRSLLPWLPSYWFLGLFHELNGSMHPALAPLARRAWMGLAIAVGGTAIAYGLSYSRTLRKIVEEPDITPGTRSLGWLSGFGSRIQTAIGQFSVRTLVRSRQHRMILAFYLGIGFAFTIFLMKAPNNGTQPEAILPLLAASILMMTLAMVGTRVVFAMPLDLRANWIFRITGLLRGPETLTASRRALLLLAAAPVWLVSAALCFKLWPWRQAAGHLMVLGLLGMLLADICLYGFRKIPFTCSYLPGKSQVHMVILSAVFLLWLVMLSVSYELEALQGTRSMAIMLVVLGLAVVCVRRGTMIMTRSEERGLQFEEASDPAVLELGLHRDGAVPTGPQDTRP